MLAMMCECVGAGGVIDSNLSLLAMSSVAGSKGLALVAWTLCWESDFTSYLDLL